MGRKSRGMAWDNIFPVNADNSSSCPCISASVSTAFRNRRVKNVSQLSVHAVSMLWQPPNVSTWKPNLPVGEMEFRCKDARVPAMSLRRGSSVISNLWYCSNKKCLFGWSAYVPWTSSCYVTVLTSLGGLPREADLPFQSGVLYWWV